MIFESISNGMGLITALAEFMGGKFNNGLFKLPETFGRGYMKAFDLGPLIKMSIHQYELKEDLIIKKTGVKTGKDVINISFRNVLLENSKLERKPMVTQNTRSLPSVQVSSPNIDLEVFIPAKSKSNSILITVHVELLKDLINMKGGNILLQNIISGEKPYLYDEIISPEMQNVAAQIFEARGPEQLREFYLKLKAEEMIYLFLVELLKRENTASYPLNVADVKTIYLIRDKLISDLSVPPDLTELTLFSNMSESKMNRLFKQIFGNSIYSYYQTLRLSEAAYLIKEENLSVSEVGYRLGFSNLSHFSRLFERHIGLKPKKYSATVSASF